MKISGYDYLSEQNSKIGQNLQDFSTKPEVSQISDTKEAHNLPNSNQVKDNKPADEGTVLKISGDALAYRRAEANQQMVASSFATTNFNTNGEEDASHAMVADGNKVLNQYRFFVQPTQYEGDEGVVKRIFG